MENNKFEMEILTRLTRIETKLENFNKTEEKAEEAYNLSKNNKEEIEKMQESNKWLVRTTVGAIIVLIINLIWNLIKMS